MVSVVDPETAAFWFWTISSRATCESPLAVVQGELQDDVAMAEVVRPIAARSGAPVAFVSADCKALVMVPPPGWGRERLLGWTAGHYEELAEFCGSRISVRIAGETETHDERS